MVFVLQLIVNTTTVKISVVFFGFHVIQRNSRGGTLKQVEFTDVIANVNKKAVNRTVSFDK